MSVKPCLFRWGREEITSPKGKIWGEYLDLKMSVMVKIRNTTEGKLVKYVTAGNFYETIIFSSCMALQLLYRVLAFSTNSFQLLLSWARVFQFGTFIFCISFLTSSAQRIFGLPIGLLASFQSDRASSVFVLGWSLLCSYVLLFHPAPG
jgi:hypothetical protein